MPRDTSLKKVMVVGSGPIIIGQAAEFDYAGTQACRALAEEGLEVVLVNSNPATIMTDAAMADRTYIEPLDTDTLTRIIARERPQGLVPTLGGQVGLNLAKDLAESGILDRYGVKLLGTPLDSIRKAEDREEFRQTMRNIGEPIPASSIISSLVEGQEFTSQLGYPVVIRPAYTLGGSGGGFALNRDQLEAVIRRGLRASPIGQVLIEKSVAGWKEIEFEVMRDGSDNCITVCSMENVDPVGVHTGDSVVVAPALTLADREYQMLRSAALKIIRALGIEGGCNIQFALDPKSFDYVVIEVNPRVSRSSALASKATGYPIAKVASKIAVGLRLDEIQNAVTQKTTACFEPTLDYVVVKIPRWPFDKFGAANRSLNTQMKATGEVMAIERTFEAALLKAVRSLESGVSGLRLPELADLSTEDILEMIRQPNDRRLFALAEGLYRGMSDEEVFSVSAIDPFFTAKIRSVIQMERLLESMEKPDPRSVPVEIWAQAKRMGLSDENLAQLLGTTEDQVRAARKALGVMPTYKMVDTCAAEFEAATPYFYSSYEIEDEVSTEDRRRALVLGSGPIRIGQGIEFDYCSVHSVWALADSGIETVIVNNNPETVSTDFDTSDRLYFEPLEIEDVLNVVDREKPESVIAQFGGQTAVNLAGPLEKRGISILGTSADSIDRAEDRDRFDQLLEDLNIPRPPGKAVTSFEEALSTADRIGYPAVVRPSYVLGGRAMEIVYNRGELKEYLETAVSVSPRHPVLVDRFLRGTEIEVDAVSDGHHVLIPGIMEHIEKAGIHSGDSIAVYPTISLGQKDRDRVVDYTTRLARALGVRGIMNVQYVLREGEVYVIEVNPRSSRTVPFLSKVTGVPMVQLATRASLGHSLPDMGYDGGLLPDRPYVAVKAPVFSFAKLVDLDTYLGPEMKSTGEVMGIDLDFPRAFFKAMLAAGLHLPGEGKALVTIGDRDKETAVPLLARLEELGFALHATQGTARSLRQAGSRVEEVNKIKQGSPHVVDLIRSGEMDLVVNTFTRGRGKERDGFRIRRASAEMGIPCLTSLDTFGALVEVLLRLRAGADVSLLSLQEYMEMGSEPAAD